MAYLMAVEGEPDAAIAEAVRRFIRGEVRRERHTFMPSTAELAIEVRARAEYARLMAAAEARAALPSSRSRQQIEAPVSPEERNKVAKLMAGLAGQLRMQEKPKPASEEELAETAFDLAGVQGRLAQGHSPVTTPEEELEAIRIEPGSFALSPAALAKVGKGG